METQHAPASSPSGIEGPAPKRADWRPAPGIMDRMSAYRDWWNIPQNRRRRGTGKAPLRDRADAG